MPLQLKSILTKIRWPERIFFVALAVYLALGQAAPTNGFRSFSLVIAFLFGFWIAFKLVRYAARKAIWRLRNRLLVTYIFIGGIPIVLLAALAGLGIWLISSQLAVFLVSSELERRVDSLKQAAESIAKTDPSNRADTIKHIDDLFYFERFPGLAIMVRGPGGVTLYPPDAAIEPPPAAWKAHSGIVLKDDAFYAWSHVPAKNAGDVTVLAPMGADQLAKLVTNLGIAELLSSHPTPGKRTKKIAFDGREIEVSHPTDEIAGKLPPPAFRFDFEVSFPSLVSVAIYDTPNKEENTLLFVTSRLSAVYNVLMSRKSDWTQGIIPVLLFGTSIAFLIVEMVALVVGFGMTRTITNAVHHLYHGTQRVMHGDFTHRIEVKGRDQLSDLSQSFNTMTGRIEELLTVAKEKERLQSEIEIAREVQGQLYPKKSIDSQTLKVTASCKPARMVSGDYFDYESVNDGKVSIALGDVAGKGISAALLMATLQSSLRTELRHCGEPGAPPISTACLVTHLNAQLYANTSAEKYATFFLGVYDSESGALKYTNGGHLPPILVRDGEATRLNVDGTVVGAFPFAQFEESSIELRKGDLLVCFTDGVSEPENAYGEMFGEDRLAELVIKNINKSDGEIVDTIIAAVEEWTGTPELQDDLTLLLARRV